MGNPSKKRKIVTSPDQLSFFPKDVVNPKKLSINRDALSGRPEPQGQVVDVIPELTLPTRWEKLEPKLENNDVSIRNVIRPVHSAMDVVRSIVDYLKSTQGCQVLVIRADTGSGKTTFLNTLPHYMQDIEFHKQTIDIQRRSAEEFGTELWKTPLYPTGINLIILEGREKPEAISDSYIQIVLSNINRFARSTQYPILFVIPTTEEQVARSWCDHGVKIGDLIPEQTLFEGSRWYTFPGVPKNEFTEITHETVRTLNPGYNLYDFAVSSDELKNWADTAPTIGRYIETVANKIATRRRARRTVTKGRREHVWVIYCNPDLRHFDHTYYIIQTLAQDEHLRVSPVKLIPPSSDNAFGREWRGAKWAKLVAAINFLDIRVINLPIISVVSAALAYCDEDLLQSFKETKLEQLRKRIPKDMQTNKIKWSENLADRRLQTQNATESLERSNLFLLLKKMAAETQKGGNQEPAKLLAQYLHLREHTNEHQLHLFVGKALIDLLNHHQFPGFIGVETEKPLITGQNAPIPDITIHTETDTYALELHFMNKQITPSEASRYALERVIEKYMRELPHLKAQLETIEA